MPYTYEYQRPSLSVDVAVVTREAKPRVLLIRRRGDPFAGSWALPGGFVDPDEAPASAAARELREETGVTSVDLEQLGTFGDPGRDPRGWTVTVAFLARADAETANAVAADDAAAVGWYPLEAPPGPLAFDHARI